MLAEYEDPGIDAAHDEALKQFMAERRAVLADSVEEE
jgi:trimethylamine:corrinoid methyltransferase-like protein